MIKEVIVVEGHSDTKRLQSFFEVETIETHGLGLDQKTLDYIRETNEKRGVILLLDPDSPGERIRKMINDHIPGLKNAFVLKKNARTSRKVGIEHADKKTIEEALNHLISFEESKKSITQEEFNSLGLNGAPDSATRRDLVSEKFHLGKCNAKIMLKRLNLLGISKKEIEEVL